MSGWSSDSQATSKGSLCTADGDGDGEDEGEDGGGGDEECGVVVRVKDSIG